MTNFFHKLLAASFTLLFVTSLQAAPIYKWKDEHGNINFGSEPPAQHQSEPVKIYKPKPTSDANTNIQAPAAKPEPNEQAEIDRQVRKEVEAQEAQMKKQCTELRTRLAQLKNNPRLMAEVNGETVRLSEDERQTRIKETEQQIGEFCN